MRLVNADNLKIPKDAPYKASTKRTLMQQPTAFDVDSLLAKLKNTKRMNNYLFDIAEKDDKCKPYYDGICVGITNAIQEIESELGNYKESGRDGYRWILCKNELPKEEQRVLITTKSGAVTAATYSRKFKRDIQEGFMLDDGFVLGVGRISAWMSTPKAYMEGEE